jgi:hypothetical protein
MSKLTAAGLVTLGLSIVAGYFAAPRPPPRRVAIAAAANTARASCCTGMDRSALLSRGAGRTLPNSNHASLPSGEEMSLKPDSRSVRSEGARVKSTL